MKCKKCGSELQEKALFCHMCGTKIEIEDEEENASYNICPDCGTKNDKNKKFCVNCGFYFGSLSSSSVENPTIEKPSIVLEEKESSISSSKWWNFKDGVLTIFCKGKMPDCNFEKKIYLPWDNYNYKPFIKSIVIDDSVTSIGNHAFYQCFSLTNIKIPSSVTSIGEFAFCDCDNLTSVTIPSSVTSIGKCAFSGCDSLTSITIPKHLKDYFKGFGYECIIISGD